MCACVCERAGGMVADRQRRTRQAGRQAAIVSSGCRTSELDGPRCSEAKQRQPCWCPKQAAATRGAPRPPHLRRGALVAVHHGPRPAAAAAAPPRSRSRSRC